MLTKLNIHDFNDIIEAIVNASKSGNLNETLARELVDKMTALRVETIKGAN